MEQAAAEKMVDSLFKLAKKEISHMWNCSENIENLKKEAHKLSTMKGRIQQRIDLAKSKGEPLLNGVEEWINTSGDKIPEALEFAEKAEANKTCCNLRFCVNLGALYRYGKMAAEKTSFLVEHQEGGTGFETSASVPGINPGFMDLYQKKDLENIHTQKSALKAIVGAFKDHQIVGIVGLGGVGKTTLANEVATELKNQFDHIEFIAISQTINVEKIKDGVGIAAKKIIKGEKVLIILDDVWDELKLDEVGIPCGSKYMNCKILLTSRKKEVCNKPGCNIQEAKDKVIGAVESLKSCFLLLPGRNQKEEGFKMHDLVRDMAILITSKRNNDKFLVLTGQGLTEWQSIKDLERYTKISFVNNEICELPDHELLFPNIDTFLVRENKLSTVPKKIFEDMKKLKVLNMSWNRISSLPQSLKEVITVLTMLDLSHNESLCEISILGKLICLEILKLKQTGITIIPEEIGKLTKLRLLDVYECSKLSYVTPGVISKLIRLEELYLGLTKEGNCEVLAELSKLKSLVILHLDVPILRYIPKDFNFETLIEFYITDQGSRITRIYKHILDISEVNFSFTMPIMKLIQLSEMLCLGGIEDLVNILTELYQKGVNEFKRAVFVKCKNVKRLVNACDLDAMQNSYDLGQKKTKEKFFTKLEEIWLAELDSLEVLWSIPLPYISFCNLANIIIVDCPAILELFPLSVAQGLLNLRELVVQYCESLVVVISTTSGTKTEETTENKMKQIVGNEIEETSESKTELVEDTIFPFLNYIHFLNLPKLVSFYSGRYTIRYPSLRSLKVSRCGSMKRWSLGENHIPNIKFEYQNKIYSDINDYIAAQLEMSGKVIISKRCT